MYLDNSGSMSLKKGTRTLLDIARDALRQQLKAAAPDTRFLLATNDKPVSYQPMSREKMLEAVEAVNPSAVSKSGEQIFAEISSLLEAQGGESADIYYYSDFQKNSFPSRPDLPTTGSIRFHGMPVRPASPANIFIDTAFLATPVLQPGQDNRIIVKTKLVGAAPKESPVLQLSVNGQTKSATSVAFDDAQEQVDTLSFRVNETGWQKILLTINDAAVRFDDSFRITARSATNLSVLVLNEGSVNPYLQAALRSYNGFLSTQLPLGPVVDWKHYNLVIINGITRLPAKLSEQILQALDQGQSVCIFPGKTDNISALNEGLGTIAGIRFEKRDTSVQTATNLQQGSELVREIFERIPDNVQLPTASWHYSTSAALAANQQSVLSFRNGEALFAQFTPSRGKLYLLTTDLMSGNFAGSYFFVPFIYGMTTQSRSSDVFALTAGNLRPVFLPVSNDGERNMVHITKGPMDMIPPQRPSGAGLNVYLAGMISEPGFYNLVSTGRDTVAVALNPNRAESYLALWDLETLKQNWKAPYIYWQKPGDDAAGEQAVSSFPLWKVCAILALFMLAAETFLLAGNFGKKTVAPR